MTTERRPLDGAEVSRARVIASWIRIIGAPRLAREYGAAQVRNLTFGVGIGADGLPEITHVRHRLRRSVADLRAELDRRLRRTS